MMIKQILYSLIITIVLFSCGDNAKKDPVTDTDVATTFIRAVLDDDFKTAGKYLLNDDTNRQYFETFQRNYQAKGAAELEKYKSADIIINTIEPVNDTSIVNYSNSYQKNTQTKLKLVRSNGKWLVDLKYTFEKR
jgi:hypothetical protein